MTDSKPTTGGKTAIKFLRNYCPGDGIEIDQSHFDALGRVPKDTIVLLPTKIAATLIKAGLGSADAAISEH